MVLRFLLRYFLNKTDLVDRMANSRIMRRAAQMTVYVFHRSKAALEDQKATELKDKFKDAIDKAAPLEKVKRFKTTFKDELWREWEKRDPPKK